MSVFTLESFQRKLNEIVLLKTSNQYFARLYLTPFSIEDFSVFEQQRTSFSNLMWKGFFEAIMRVEWLVMLLPDRMAG